MSETESKTPGLDQVLSAMIFGAQHPVSVAQMKQVLVEVADIFGGSAQAFAQVKESEIVEALNRIGEQYRQLSPGFHLVEVAQGYAFRSDPAFGMWLRHLLDRSKSARLSRPALETLAIIAYRQPVMRSEIEGVRGVNVDHIIKLLMEMQLIRIAGRSELPGRPLLYGTTGLFLEHFGLKGVKDLPGIDELSRIELERTRAATQTAETAAVPAAEGGGRVEADESIGQKEAPGSGGTPEAAPEPEGETREAADGEVHAGSDEANDESDLDDDEDDDDEDDDEDEDEDEEKE
jgi:segregation and condensation protein B